MPTGHPAKITLIRKGINPYAHKSKNTQRKVKKSRLHGHVTKKGFKSVIPKKERLAIQKEYLKLIKEYSQKTVHTILTEKYNRDVRTIATFGFDALENERVKLLAKSIKNLKEGKPLNWMDYQPRAMELFHNGLFGGDELTATEKDFMKMVFRMTNVFGLPIPKSNTKTEGDEASDIFPTGE